MQNNLGVLYHKVNLPDSSIHYFFRAKHVLKEKGVASSNIIYLLAKKNLFDDADSIMQSENYPDNISFLNNKLAVLNQLGKKSLLPFDGSLVKDSILNANTYAYLVNSNLNSLNDTLSTISSRMDELKQKPSNESYQDNLTCQLALKNIIQAIVLERFRI